MSRDVNGPSAFRVDVEELDVGVRVVPDGELDLATVDALDAAVRDRLAAGPVSLDMTRLSFMDSSGVRLLDELVRAPGTLRFVLPDSGAVREVLDMTGMTRRLQAVQS